MHDVSLKVGTEEFGFYQVAHIAGPTESSFTFFLPHPLHIRFVRLEATGSRLQLCEVQVFALCQPGITFTKTNCS